MPLTKLPTVPAAVDARLAAGAAGPEMTVVIAGSAASCLPDIKSSWNDGASGGS